MSKPRKTRKLICQVTGKPLMAAAEYYAKKLSKYDGDEDKLHNEYICQQAKKYLQKGYSIQETRDAVGIYKTFKSPLEDEDIPKLLNDKSLVNLRINNIDSVKLGVIKTDPDVQEFINSLRDE